MKGSPRQISSPAIQAPMKTLVAFVALAVSLFTPQLFANDGEDTRPNFILIFADDLGINDLHCYGREDHRTPHLDALAQRGIRYTSAYCGLSICSASRASLMTGKSSARLHLTSFLPGRADNPSQRVLNARIHSSLPPEERTIAEELKRAGYRTGMFGKWHLGGKESSPKEQGFETVAELPAKGELNEETGNKNEFLIARRAAEFISTPSNQPYFCYIPHHSPHIRLEATEEAKQKNSHAFNPLYAASIESLDRSVGMLLEAIEKQPSARETYILFTSDNGGLHVRELHEDPMTHNTPFRAGKGYLYEGGIRIPLIVASTKQSVAPNRVSDAPVSLLDLMPTFLKLASVNVGQTLGPLDGVDLSNHWIGDKEPSMDRPLYWNFPHYTNQGSRPAAAIRKGNWKGILQYEDESFELYDLAKDAGEETDLASSMPDKAKELRGELERWLRSVGGQRCVPNPDFDPEQYRAIYQQFDSSRLRATDTAQKIGEEWKVWRDRMDNATQGRKPELKTPQGTITLLASQAVPHGKKLRYEPELHKNVLGYWTEVEDWAHWELDVPENGTYEIEVQCGCGAGNGGSQVSLSIGDQAFEWVVPDTGHYQNMIYLFVGNANLVAGKARLEVRPKTKTKIAVMDIRKIVLRNTSTKGSPQK